MLLRENSNVTVPLVCAVRLLLHHFEDLLAGVGAVIGIAVDSDGFLQRSDVVFAMHVYSGARHLRDLAYGGTLSANNSANHVRLDEDAQRKVGLPAGTRKSGEGDAAAALAAAPSSALRGHLHFQRIAVVFVAIQLVHSPAKSLHFSH